MASIKGANHLIACLEAHGISRIYGVPGEETEDLQFALEKSTIEFIICRHEQAAAFIAGAEGHLTGLPGVCLSTLGPGATNLVTGIASAQQDHAPVIVITAQAAQSRQHQLSHQLIDVIGMMKPLVKWSYALTNVNQISEVVAKAYKTATTPKYGVCHIEMPEDVAAAVLDNKLPMITRNVMMGGLSSDHIETIVGHIDSADRPIIYAGAGINRQGVNDALFELVQKTNIPVISTFMGKGSIPDSSPWSLRCIGLGLEDIPIKAIRSADLIISIGVDLAEYHPKNLSLHGDTTVIHIHSQPVDVYDDYNPQLEYIADLNLAVKDILKLVKDKSVSKETAWFESHRAEIIKNIERFHLLDSDDEFTVPGIVGAIEQSCGDDALLISDVGAHKMWIARNYKTDYRNGCMISNNFASMGIALPTAVAAAFQGLDKTIIAMIGDGGFMMNCQTLATAQQYDLAMTLILMVDGDYGLISWKQERSEDRSTGTRFFNPDFVKMVESFGCNTFSPQSIGELKQALIEVKYSKDVNVIIVPVYDKVNQTLEKINIA